MLSSISISDFLKIADRVNIIDTRNIESYNSNHIPRSKNISLEKLLVEPNRYLLPFEKYYIYCQKGTKSQKIVQILNKKGYTTFNINGGYEAWILEK